MTTRKNRVSKLRKDARGKYNSLTKKRIVRRHRASTAGKIMPPLDVRSSKHLKEFEKRIKKGPLTIVLVYADWCGHCHTMMPHFDNASKSTKRSIQSVKINEQMLPSVNSTLNQSVNKSAKPISVDGYPSIIVIDKLGNKVGDIEPVRNTQTMTKVMENAGTLATQAGLNSPKPANNAVSLANNSIPASSQNQSNRGLKETSATIESDIPEPSILNEPVEPLANSFVPSSFNSPPSTEQMPSNNIKDLSQEAEEITSLASPLMPPNMNNDTEVQNIEPAQRISGGRRGGSMYSALVRTTYTLAPAAALLATSAFVLKGKKQTHKKNKHNKSKTKRLRR